MLALHANDKMLCLNVVKCGREVVNSEKYGKELGIGMGCVAHIDSMKVILIGWHIFLIFMADLLVFHLCLLVCYFVNVLWKFLLFVFGKHTFHQLYSLGDL